MRERTDRETFSRDWFFLLQNGQFSAYIPLCQLVLSLTEWAAYLAFLTLMFKNRNRHETYYISLKLTWVLCYIKAERKHNGLLVHNKSVVSVINNTNHHLK